MVSTRVLIRVIDGLTRRRADISIFRYLFTPRWAMIFGTIITFHLFEVDSHAQCSPFARGAYHYRQYEIGLYRRDSLLYRCRQAAMVEERSTRFR